MLPFISCLNQGQGTTYITEHRPISIQHWSMYDAEGRSGEMLDVVFNSNLIKTSVAGCRSCSGKRAKERTPTQKKRESMRTGCLLAFSSGIRVPSAHHHRQVVLRSATRQPTVRRAASSVSSATTFQAPTPPESHGE